MSQPTREWPLAEEPVPVRLMATIWADTSGRHDDLDNPAGLQDWMDAVGIEHAKTLPTPDELSNARQLRDALRRLAAHQTDDQRAAAVSAMTEPARAVGVLNAAASRLPAPQLELTNELLRRSHTSPDHVAAGLAVVATEAIYLFGGDEANNLRACQAPGCVLYFVKSHPRREWCSIACGNRARAARHYQRTRQIDQLGNRD
jgi:predicted RNA-binding Zn ribbon-like protein